MRITPQNANPPLGISRRETPRWMMILYHIPAPKVKGKKRKKIRRRWGDGDYIASAYPRDKSKESAYVDWIRKLRYININKIAGLNLEVGTVSRLKPQASGEDVKTAEDFSSWSSAYIIPQTDSESQEGKAKKDPDATCM